jgi:hypothetical protein
MEASKVISKDEAPGGRPSIPEDITALMDREHSKDIIVPLDGRFRECNL